MARAAAVGASRAGRGWEPSSDTQHWRPESTLYTTQPGDTLGSVAASHGVSVRFAWRRCPLAFWHRCAARVWTSLIPISSLTLERGLGGGWGAHLRRWVR